MVRQLLQELASSSQRRHLFFARVSRMGTRSHLGYRIPTVAIEHVMVKTGHAPKLENVANHIWLDFSKPLQLYGVLKQGDKISFLAGIHIYTKQDSLGQQTVDWGLTTPSSVRVVRNGHSLFPSMSATKIESWNLGSKLDKQMTHRQLKHYYKKSKK